MIRKLICSLLLLLSVTSPAGAAPLSKELDTALKESKYVYIASTRKDGTPSKAAEIWFFYHSGSVYIGTKPDSWRAKRIKWGRPQATIAVGKQDGPSFQATGSIVKDSGIEQLMFKSYASRYPDGWPKYEKQFREGFSDGTRVMIKYTPK